MSRSDHTEALVIRYALAEASREECIAWACDMLVTGHDTKHLRYLAGRSHIDLDSEVFSDFESSLRELNHKVPPKADSLHEYSCYICQKIVGLELDSGKGHAVLYKIWIANVGDPRRLDRRYDIWMYISDSLKLLEDGYSPLIPEIADLTAETYPDIVRREAQKFLDRYCNNS